MLYMNKIFVVINSVLKSVCKYIFNCLSTQTSFMFDTGLGKYSMLYTEKNFLDVMKIVSEGRFYNLCIKIHYVGGLHCFFNIGSFGFGLNGCHPDYSMFNDMLSCFYHDIDSLVHGNPDEYMVVESVEVIFVESSGSISGNLLHYLITVFSR